ncbi:MAG: PAS domain-containing protein, partial [Thermoplasmata archaeon]|nr:PAS domain-containing protein [Thermoplasmata archaeon]
RDVAEFWIEVKGRMIYIRYFPVHGKNGDYIGCLEVTQDITDVKKIEGSKRLL